MTEPASIHPKLTPEQLEALRAMPLGAMANRVSIALTMVAITQTDLCSLIGMSRPKLSKIANGYYKAVAVDDARHLAEFFGCQIEDLFPAREAVSA